MSLENTSFEFTGCQRCGACCRWPGQVRVSPEEIRQIALYLGSNEWSFIQRFTRLGLDRMGLVLEDKGDGECVFLTPEGCSIQPAKPQQCRDFPYRWHNPGLEQFCAGMKRREGVQIRTNLDLTTNSR